MTEGRQPADPLEFPIPRLCPVCAKEPYVEECWPRGAWAVGCYGVNPTEHFVGVNGNSRLEAIRIWNAEATAQARARISDEWRRLGHPAMADFDLDTYWGKSPLANL